MPHGSGGGSHGGGSHGGHGGAGGTGARVSSKPFPGSHRYIYYNKRRPVIVYSDKPLTTDPASVLFVVLAVYAFFFAFVLFFAGIVNLTPPSPIKTDYDTSIIIKDEAGILTDEEVEDIEEAFVDFRRETGITPAFYTVNNEDWYRDKKLEKYAYDLYLELFDDEKHWLIVYSEPRNPDPSFNDWHWEGMQGDDTDRVLTRKKADFFNGTFHSNLLKNTKYTVGEALADAFNRLTPRMMKQEKGKTPASIIAMVCSAPLTALGVFLIIIAARRTKKMKNSFRADEETIRQMQCEYCGGIYVAGHHTNCPHCQAQIPQTEL